MGCGERTRQQQSNPERRFRDSILRVQIATADRHQNSSDPRNSVLTSPPLLRHTPSTEILRAMISLVRCLYWHTLPIRHVSVHGEF